MEETAQGSAAFVANVKSPLSQSALPPPSHTCIHLLGTIPPDARPLFTLR